MNKGEILQDFIKNNQIDQVILLIENLNNISNSITNSIYQLCKYGDISILNYLFFNNKWKHQFRQVVIQDAWLTLEWASINHYQGSQKMALIYQVLIEHIMAPHKSVQSLVNTNLQWGVLREYVHNHWSVYTYQETLKQMIEDECQNVG